MSQQVTFSDYLLCLEFYRKLDEKKFSALLEKVKPVAARNPLDLALLMDWLNKNGLSAEVVKWMEKLPSELTTNPPPAIAIADAFAEAKNWSRLKRWTRGGAWGDSEYLRLAYQAYSSKQSRQTSSDAEFSGLWRSAERAASEQPEREINLARLASKWNFSTEAEQLWLRVSKEAPMRREALDALSRIYRTNNDLPNLYRIAERLHENSPNEPGLAANCARLAMLVDQNPAEGHRLAKETYDRTPDDVNVAMTYAFSLYGLGRTAEGVEIMKKLPPKECTIRTPPSTRRFFCSMKTRRLRPRNIFWPRRLVPFFPRKRNCSMRRSRKRNRPPQVQARLRPRRRSNLGSAGCQPAVVGSLPATPREVFES